MGKVTLSARTDQRLNVICLSAALLPPLASGLILATYHWTSGYGGPCQALACRHGLWTCGAQSYLLPVTCFTWATPWESRRTTPIWEGVAPFFASLHCRAKSIFPPSKLEPNYAYNLIDDLLRRRLEPTVLIVSAVPCHRSRRSRPSVRGAADSTYAGTERE